MEPTKTKATITITKPSANFTQDIVRIKIQDQISRVVIVELELTLEQYVQALFSQVVEDIEAEVPLQDARIGKELVVTTKFLDSTLSAYSSHKELENYFKENVPIQCGMTVSSCIGSQNAVVPTENGCKIKYIEKSWKP